MFVFGHLGIGNALAAPFRRGLPRGWLFLGMLLPDIQDKLLYYSLSLATGMKGAELGLISGTRTFGHTALFLLALALVALARKSRVLAAISLGIATHLVLDGLSEPFGPANTQSFAKAVLWPFTGLAFPTYPFADSGEHFRTLTQPYLLGGELAGVLLLFWDVWKQRHRHEIRVFLKSLAAGRNARRLRNLEKH
ncbi:MAG: metal-dependent hydrolase [Oligoflexia bacterium]|nr:metal-dependent hydrolase [Oligoflexia bacterium]